MRRSILLKVNVTIIKDYNALSCITINNPSTAEYK